jgi:hypothetical protein
MTTLALTPEILHGGTAVVILPESPTGHAWRVEWRVVGTTDDWHVAAGGISSGEYAVSDTRTPEPQHRIEWQAVAEVRGAGSYCTVCGAPGAVPQGYSDPVFGPVALCAEHRHCELDWA